MIKARRQSFQVPERHSQNHRSAFCSRGLGQRRLNTVSCWRRAKFSRAISRTVLGRQNEKANQRTKDCKHEVQREGQRVGKSTERPTRLVSAGINRHGVTNGRVVRKGLATHLESESCEGGRKVALEALTGAYAGRVLSSEIGNSGSRRCQLNRKVIRQHASWRVQRHPAESETPGMHRNSMRENRETPWPAAARLGGP